jgi:acetyl-CoA carboxylase, biotin carboxylase subunit
MFKKVLIANRGEIALRVIRACRELGIQTVAVYSEADRESLHVRFADDDVCIGPPFSEMCTASGITFIGPSAHQIRVMGDKASARKAMADCGVPIVPGTPGPVEDVDEALAFAESIGFPVIIKASAGGGGKGMRVANDADDFARSFGLARSEALSAFGNGDVYVEKYLLKPRHVEFQILGDTHGNCIHLGERDCSVQRRHQKLIEEAPSPAMTPDLRARMGSDAVRGAKAIDYVGAGTIEMLLDTDGSYYFMEMNTRIQVEHPVTEMLTGVDLVQEQIRVAAGLEMRVKEMPPLRGHVMECRVNAEDPMRNFQPSPGKITSYHPPGGPGVRVDSHVYAGYTVPPYYDSLLAKLIVQAATREECVKRMQNATFQSGDFDTKFLERETDLFAKE